MFAADFEYRKAGSIMEAVQLLADNPGAKLLAGGHSLIPLMRFRLARPEVVIDIGGIANLRGITVSGDTINIGTPKSPTPPTCSGPTACWPRRPAASATRRYAIAAPSAATWPTPTRPPTGRRC
ncbi:MAG: FAD binding domain-containing protein [Dehalococcoidia bacterium]|nr:FAD binding domain-containing protein [Dehalococcoidia bacterium]